MRVTLAFNAAVNRQGLESLSQLMTAEHTFMDSDANILAGKTDALKAWEGFFEAFPDCWNDWSEAILASTAVVAIGRSCCATELALAGPAIWTARTAGD
jgi:hypothetical protein